VADSRFLIPKPSKAAAAGNRLRLKQLYLLGLRMAVPCDAERLLFAFWPGSSVSLGPP
jgi:hypothetical protein